MEKLLLALIVLIVLISSGCISLPPVSPRKSEYNIPIRGSVTAEQVEQIDLFLSVLPKEVRGSIASLSRRDEFSRCDKDLTGGHCHRNRHICIIDRFFTDASMVWHETGHAYDFYLLDYKGPQFRNKWRKIPGGVLTAYGKKNYQEDIAEWVSEIYCFLTGRFSVIKSLKFSGEFSKDSYLKKLKLLREYGFISSKNYKKVLQK